LDAGKSRGAYVLAPRALTKEITGNDASMMAAGEAQRVWLIEEHRVAWGHPVKKEQV